jgi:hypothetical protein
LAPLPDTLDDDFIRDLRLAQEDVAHGVVSSRAKAATAHWNKWDAFCAEIGVDPTLCQVKDPISYLQVFAYRFRTGRTNTKRRKV